jgi:hypothetical protein
MRQLTWTSGAAVQVHADRDDAVRVKILSLRRADSCAACGTALEPGTKAAWDAATRTVTCLGCVTPTSQESPPVAAPAVDVLPSAPPSLPQATPAVLPSVGAGVSAQLEYQRRSQRREQQIRSRHPKLGGLILALSNEPTSTRVWAQGARGERAVAAKIDELGGDHVIALHDRKMLRADGRASRANIDHLVVTPAAVWVVDAKTHQGQLQVRRSGGLFTPRVERLFIGGRDKTSLVEDLGRQVDAVRQVLLEVGADVPVRGALCFVGTELPWFGDSIAGVPLVGRRGLGKLLKRPGDLTAEDRQALAEYLNGRFRPA